MAAFNIFRATTYGYRQSWRARDYLLRLAPGPLLLKFGGLLLVLHLHWDARFLAQALLLLPAYGADGWMQSHYAQKLLTPSSASASVPVARGILAGTLAYAATRFFFAAVVEGIFRLNNLTLHRGTMMMQSNAVLSAMGAALLLIVVIWGFRFLWFYIPASVRYPWRAAARDLRGWQSSLCCGAAALLCFLPAMIVSAMLVSVLSNTLQGDLNVMPAGDQMGLAVFRALLDTATATVSTAALTYGLQVMIGRGRVFNRSL